MGSSVSKAQLNEYKEVVKDRMSEEAIAFLYMKFSSAAPDGYMTPLLFKRYIDSTGVYKHRKVDALATVPTPNKGRKGDSVEGKEDVEGGSGVSASDCYLHLFRGYDLDGDGLITFKEFLIYHLAMLYSTEELFYIIFNAYDGDQDGYLSLGDIKGVIVASTRYVGDYDVRDREVQRVIDEEARRLFGFLDIRRQGRVQRDDMALISQKYPQVLEKMKNLM